MNDPDANLPNDYYLMSPGPAQAAAFQVGDHVEIPAGEGETARVVSFDGPEYVTVELQTGRTARFYADELRVGPNGPNVAAAYMSNPYDPEF